MKNWRANRYEVVGSYPGATLAIGDVIEVEDADVAEYDSHTKVFKKLKWWECMETDFNSLFTVKFCKITRTKGYWRDGDILPVCGYMTDTERRKPVFFGFLLKGYSNPEKYEFDRVEPATEEEFLAWKKENKISITP